MSNPETLTVPEPPTGDAFEGLLVAMPRIADAVNAFMSEENQRIAMKMLVRAVGLPDEPTASAETAAEPGLSVVSSAPVSQVGNHVKPLGTPQRRAKRPSSKKSWSTVKDINFRPEGQQSLRDFAAEKAPGSLHEKNLVAVYYLEEVMGIPEIEVGHVLAAYEECGWKSARDPENYLQQTSSSKKWLDTANMKAIRVTHPGRNTIKYDMPAKKSA